jgi:hypothetical protein
MLTSARHCLALSAEVTISAVKFLNDSVYSAMSALSADADLEAFESTYIENFETKAASLKLNHPELHSEARSALEHYLRLARAAAAGHISLAKSVAFLIGCAVNVPGLNTSVDTCKLKAVDLWSSNVKSNLHGSWPNPGKEQSLLDAAGEVAAKAKLQYVAQGARSTIRALNIFQLCTRYHTWADLHQCTSEGKAVCLPGADCVNRIQLAAVQTTVALCEKQAIQTNEQSSQAVDTWWHTDKSGVWLSPVDIMQDLAVSFQEGPCYHQNSSKALDLQDQALRNIAQISYFRSKAVWATSCTLFIASLVIGMGLSASYFLYS